MNKVGLTGGIGSGKTTIAHFFEILGIPLYLSDQRAKLLMNTNKNLIEQIKKLLGAKSYLRNGSINKPYIASQIFNNSDLLKALNNLVHPAVHKDFKLFCNRHKNCDYVIEESAVLFETGMYQRMDANILIKAPVLDRIKRVQKRSSLSRGEVESRVSKQWTDEQKEPLSDYLIVNDNQSFITPQILQIHRCLKDIV